LPLVAMYPRRVRVVGHSFAAGAPLLTHTWTVMNTASKFSGSTRTRTEGHAPVWGSAFTTCTGQKPRH
jgi:hypothetical protein